jgi:peptidoglycan hydrolase-like protein with peptidoglycan-binding domain
VKRLQVRLNELGAALDADGDFGLGTRAAVITFQSGRGLIADGVVGKTTRAALGV